MRYWPVPSVTADLIFSISAGLVASTVTPGRMAPDVSLTVPVIAACARARFGTAARTAAARKNNLVRMFLRRGESIQVHTSEPMRVPDWFSKDCAESIQSTEGQHDHFW